MRAGYTIGLTGSVGAGKSTVLGWLAAQGAATLDADQVVHALLSLDDAVVDAVRAQFGRAVVPDPALGVDRAALAGIVFRDPVALANLERILHPAVTREVEVWLAGADAAVAVVEAVKLVESGMHVRHDRVWLVACDRDVRRRRLVKRGWSPGEAERRIGAGPALAPRLAVADTVIDNSGTRAATAAQLAVAWRGVARAMRRGG